MKKKLMMWIKTVLIFGITFFVVNELLGKIIVRFVFPLDLSWRTGIGSFGMPLALIAACFAASKFGSFEQANIVLSRPKYIFVMSAFVIGVSMPLMCIGIRYFDHKYIFALRDWSYRDIASFLSIFSGAMLEEIYYRLLLTSLLVWIFRYLPLAALLQVTQFTIGHAGFIHTGTVVMFFYYFSAGLLFTITSIRFQSLWVAIALHAGLNTAFTFLYGGSENYGEKIITEYHGSNEPVMIVLMLMASLVLLWQWRYRLTSLFSLDFPEK
jgi:membrane protease YdiL (CAAX protease family)